MKLISTGYKDIDKALGGGFYLPSVTVIGGRPSMGKTSFMIDLYKNMKSKEDFNVYFISLENTAGVLARRFHRPVIISDIRSLNDFYKAFEKERFILSNSVVFIDNINLIESEEKDLIHFMRLIKSVSIEKNIVFIISAELTKKPDERAGHRPIMTDFRGFGEVEEFADLVLLLLRREYYDPMDKPGMAELIIAKNRNGAISTVYLGFSAQIAMQDKNLEENFFHDFLSVNDYVKNQEYSPFN